ncbi:MAG: DEAD/DEAH box helicase [Nitrosomonadaceae bacterium]
MKEKVKFKVGRFLVPVTLTYVDKRIEFEFDFNRGLITEVKSMAGSKWHGYDKPNPRKIWSISNCARNLFQISYLKGDNPYAPWDKDIVQQKYDRPLYVHQKAAIDFILARRYCELAADCGLGKTLDAIEVLERIKPVSAWYVAPKSALYAVQLEMKKWNCQGKFEFMTYQGLVKRVNNFTETSEVPQFLVVDEASKIKNPTTQRSQAALIVADCIRVEWGDEGAVVLLTGTPAPRSPLDWHHQTEVCCPGFLKEGTQAKLKQTLAITEKCENPHGGSFYQIISWRDDPRKCDICGESADHENHSPSGVNSLSTIADSEEDDWHKFIPSIDEVSRLHKRLEGLVLVQFKKDCVDLPDKIYRKIELPPTPQMQQVARTILQSASTTIGGLTLLRELSDGFQYNKVADGFETCPVCKGRKRTANPLYKVACPECPSYELCKDGECLIEDPTTICDGCGGQGHRKKYKRTTEEVECPKDEALRDLLDEYGEVGRVVAYGGFQGSVDRIISICEACNWAWIRADGRGWSSDLDGNFLENFQEKVIDIPRIAFVGQPGAAGMGLTLTASPVIIYYSNDFDAEHRMQSEERTHRIGMDTNRGCTIIDLLHLPTDYLILKNLKQKRHLQSLTLGQIKESFDDKS